LLLGSGRSVNKKRRNAKDNSSAIVSLKHQQGTNQTKTDVHDETPPPFQWSHCWCGNGAKAKRRIAEKMRMAPRPCRRPLAVAVNSNPQSIESKQPVMIMTSPLSYIGGVESIRYGASTETTEGKHRHLDRSLPLHHTFSTPHVSTYAPDFRVIGLCAILTLSLDYVPIRRRPCQRHPNTPPIAPRQAR
jgi:hypothetical protein